MAADTVFIDLGNSRLKARFSTGPNITVASTDVAELSAWWPAGDYRVALASVAPANLTAAWVAALLERGVTVVRVDTEAACAGLRVAYPMPTQMGVDRFLALLDAHQRRIAPCLLVSVGTAFTVDALLSDGMHLGGWIAPTPTMAAEALAQRLPQLAAPAFPAVPAFAADTASAVAAGLLAQAGGAVLFAHRQLQSITDGATTVQLAGGDAGRVEAWLRQADPTMKIERRDDAVLNGLAAWAAAHGW